MEFKEYYIKKELCVSDGPFTEGSLGIADNLNMQWEDRYKGVGIVSTDRYLFGYTNDYGYDHSYITSELENMVDDPTIMFYVQGETDRVTVLIQPIHTSRGKCFTTLFERDIIIGILRECIEGYKTIPDDLNLQVDISEVFLDNESSLFSRARCAVEVERMIEHVSEPVKEPALSGSDNSLSLGQTKYKKSCSVMGVLGFFRGALKKFSG